jgi:hemerythrin superfamily protein
MAGKTRKSSSRSAQALDAVALLKADHRQVEGWFAQFGKSRSNTRRQQLADQICAALRVHTEIEEEIFYPAFLKATADKDMHHEAVVEHAGAKELIAQIEEMSAGDDYFEAKVTVLSEMIKHHVKEEEQPGGMFAEAKKSKMDLKALGEELRARKSELQAHDRAA